MLGNTFISLQFDFIIIFTRVQNKTGENQEASDRRSFSVCDFISINICHKQTWVGVQVCDLLNIMSLAVLCSDRISSINVLLEIITIIKRKHASCNVLNRVTCSPLIHFINYEIIIIHLKRSGYLNSINNNLINIIIILKLRLQILKHVCSLNDFSQTVSVRRHSRRLMWTIIQTLETCE